MTFKLIFPPNRFKLLFKEVLNAAQITQKVAHLLFTVTVYVQLTVAADCLRKSRKEPLWLSVDIRFDLIFSLFLDYEFKFLRLIRIHK